MKNKYVKPTILFIDIIMNDLCAGSVCTNIDVHIIPVKQKKSKTYVFHKGKTEGMWDKDF